MQYKTVARAQFLKRLNRFVATVALEGKEETVHVKNTGRCRELLLPDARVVLSRGDGAARKTAWDLVAVWKEREEGEILINMDAQAPNAAAAEWLPKSGLFSPAAVFQREVTWGNSRFDFAVREGERLSFLEVKGVTLAAGDRGFFPDAPTERGVKHVEELIRAKEEGHGAAILFVAQWERARSVSPNRATHPAFAKALERAAAAGVRLLAARCRVSEEGMEILEEIPVDLFAEM
jgi:sugar fermentation stimulation protein A